MNKPEIYISYSWKPDSNSVANELETQLDACGITLIRDKSNTGVPYMESISKFMDKIGAGNYILLVLGNDYLKSPNCMYELLKIAEDSNYDFDKIKERIFIITLPNFSVYNAKDRAYWISYWEQEEEKLQNAVKQGKDVTNYLPIINRDIPLIQGILTLFKKDIVDKISDLNTLTIEIHSKEGYKTFLQTLSKALATDGFSIDLSTVNFTNFIKEAEKETTTSQHNTNTTMQKNDFDLEKFKGNLKDLAYNHDYASIVKELEQNKDLIKVNIKHFESFQNQYTQKSGNVDFNFTNAVEQAIDGIKKK